MVALVTSILVTAAMVVLLVWYGKRRPTDRPTTWGEAMLAAAYIFMLLLLLFGIVPDRWIRLTDNEWGWSVERFLFTEGQFMTSPITFPPMRMDLKKVSDIVVVIEHLIALVGLPVLALWWQRRDQAAPAEVPISEYGRPLIRSN
ncbi:hypothetical protein [Candidatus Poriferisodalis sp.]|uniref:hypothetical protein n=1 Tax=Candidatus Poriferisodalis sp. TaxID=3101277 RepID=UPI003B01ACE8